MLVKENWNAGDTVEADDINEIGSVANLLRHITMTAGHTVAAGDSLGVLPVPVAEVLRDTSTSGSATGSSASPTTFSFTVGNNSNRILVIFTDDTGGNFGPDAVTGITYAGDALTQISWSGDGAYGSFTSNRCQAWYLLNPDVGANNIVMTYANATSRAIRRHVFSFYNVSAVASVGSSSNPAGSPAAIALSVAPTTNGSVLVGMEKGDLTASTVIANNISTEDTGSAGWCNPVYPISIRTINLSSGGNAAMAIQLTPVMTSATYKVYKTAGGFATRATGFVGFASEAADLDDPVVVTVNGVEANQSGLTPGAIYYVSDTEGDIGSSAGSTSQKVGKALSATQLLIINDV
jgi:hypothetical protein